MDWFSGWDVPVLQGWLDGVSSATGQWPTVLTAGVALILAILLSGPNKGIALGVTFGIIGTADLIVGETLARIVGRIRPNEDPGSISFPSGHVAFVTSAATLLVYVAANHRIRRPWVLFLALVLGFFAVSVGISRVNQLAHWPSDVLGGYLLGFIRPLLLIPVYHRMEQVRWVTPRGLGTNMPEPEGSAAIVEGSYGSAVVIEP